MENQIIRETTHWLAVNKPAGLIVERNPWEPSVESLLFDYLQKKQRKPFLGVVHRLDRVTTGVLLFAKKKSTLKQLNEQFREKRVQKTYLAIVELEPPQREGTLVHWLFKDQKNKRAVISDRKAKNSAEVHLHYRLLESISNGHLLLITPRTGKFHQIRAQLAFAGCPIIGDIKYGATEAYLPKAVALHAWKLAFFDHKEETETALEAPLPQNEWWQGLQSL